MADPAQNLNDVLKTLYEMFNEAVDAHSLCSWDRKIESRAAIGQLGEAIAIAEREKREKIKFGESANGVKLPAAGAKKTGAPVNQPFN